MGNKLQIKLLDNVSSKNYCSKCLCVFGDEVVRDNEGNEFCDEKCRREYWAEIRREFDCQYREWRNGGR